MSQNIFHRMIYSRAGKWVLSDGAKGESFRSLGIITFLVFTFCFPILMDWLALAQPLASVVRALGYGGVYSIIDRLLFPQRSWPRRIVWCLSIAVLGFAMSFLFEQWGK